MLHIFDTRLQIVSNGFDWPNKIQVYDWYLFVRLPNETENKVVTVVYDNVKNCFVEQNTELFRPLSLFLLPFYDVFREERAMSVTFKTSGEEEMKQENFY